MKAYEFVRLVDHSVLKPELTSNEVREAVEFAKKTNCKSVCVLPPAVALATEILNGSDVEVGAVCGFPNGAHLTEIKVLEAKRAAEMGASELDMVMNLSALTSGQYDVVRDDISAVVAAFPGAVKVILEASLLTDEQIVRGSQLVEDAGAAFVKSGTGFAGPTTVKQICLMKQTVGDRILVKAAGGMRNLADCLAMIEAGADRIGISRTKSILLEMPDGEGLLRG